MQALSSISLPISPTPDHNTIHPISVKTGSLSLLCSHYFIRCLIKKPPQASILHWSYHSSRPTCNTNCQWEKLEHCTDFLALLPYDIYYYIYIYMTYTVVTAKIQPQEDSSGINTSQTCPYQLPELDPNEQCDQAQKIFFSSPFFFLFPRLKKTSN